MNCDPDRHWVRRDGVHRVKPSQHLDFMVQSDWKRAIRTLGPHMPLLLLPWGPELESQSWEGSAQLHSGSSRLSLPATPGPLSLCPGRCPLSAVLMSQMPLPSQVCPPDLA